MTSSNELAQKHSYSFFFELELFLTQVFSFPQFLSIYKKAFNGKLPVDKKTLAKILKGKPVSEASLIKFLDGLNSLDLNMELSIENSRHLTGSMTLCQAQWWGFLNSASLSNQARSSSLFLERLKSILAEDISLTKACIAEVDLTVRQKNFWGSDLARLLLLTNEKIVPPKEKHEILVSIGRFSMLLYILSVEEVASKVHSGFELHSSWLENMLPSIDDEVLVWPLKRLFSYWKDEFNLSGMDELARCVPTKFGTDIDNRRRKLFDWQAGSYAPSSDVLYSGNLLKWVESIVPATLGLERVTVEMMRFQRVVAMQKFFKLMHDNEETIPDSALVEVFQVYLKHYEINVKNYQGLN